MEDTNKILNVFEKDQLLSSSEVLRLLNTAISQVTVKRKLSGLVLSGFLVKSGAGRSVKYSFSKKGWMLKPVDTQKYLANAPDDRLKNQHFQFDVFEPPYICLFSEDELVKLDEATKKFRKMASTGNGASHAKELMRFVIEFSWKTSQIEGNTYDLISAEQLLLYGEKSPGHTEQEAQMIINQKKAFEFIIENNELWASPNVSTLEMLHSIVGDKLGISRNLRKTIVGITGTNYRPLESQFQIKDALELLFINLAKAKNIYEKALLAVLGVSYIQPFIDGNKRTSRLLSNAILMTENYAPLSYRSVNDRDYKEACLIFYEQNSIEPFKKLFIEQYIFAANNYNIARK